NNEVLFAGIDAAYHDGLWVTDGTAAGTHEITGISGASTSGIFKTLSYPDLTVFNNDVLFEGVYDARKFGIWVTNGTAAGTHEITNINGPNAGGLNPLDLTIFKGQALFENIDAAGNRGLWVTDGTAAGTHEITGISGAYAGGIFATAFFPDFTVFKDEVLFEG